ncbi:Adenylate cyclase, class 3 [Ekhidna lutea]|uniref:Adenylate cyclase, class 3 n=1 Tax=Ekhidna lutea TaxID=447679 RepID=A0A239IFW5_EKHLU|nr:adenylate/guanylate cyclase domain-containing protein [Ekhidna lutea]SNS91923.1 Adenylate cyclase, class 3 [Ekhidna lutea]
MQIEELEKCIDLEIVKTEKRRLEIFIGILVIGLVLLLTNMIFFPTTISDTFLDERSIKLGVYTSAGFIVILLISRWMVGKIADCEKPLPIWYKYYSVISDSIVPFIWLYFIIKWEGNGIFLDSPLIFIFVPIIIVSALYLNFWISFMNGALISMMYVIIIYWTFETYDTASMLPSIVYYTKAIMFLIAGTCAGLVASELSKRLTVSIKTQEERDQIESLFSKQVSKEVVQALTEAGGASFKIKASVLFLDIRDFTQRVQLLSPEDVNEFQNRFFGPIMDCIHNNGGMINQIMGDGLMASFASEDGDTPENAFKAGRDILSKISAMNKSDWNEEIKVGIGIHNGEIIAGNIGNSTRQQFSISGIPVITAARLEQLTKDYNCSWLVSSNFYNDVKHMSSNGTSLGNVKLKGIDQEMEIIKLA